MAEIQNLDALKALLAPEATVDLRGDENFQTTAQRWSELGTPKPGAVVNVTSEADVEATVGWATAHKIPFVAQSGAHGWSGWYRIDGGGIVINMRRLNRVDVDMARGVAVIGGGALVGEVLAAAKRAGAHVATGTCNTVGAIPPMLGGGTGYMMGHLGLGADNMISARLTTAAGTTLTVSAAEHPDLWWALRGAGHNFGIVSSVTVRAHPEINGGAHYTAVVGFPREALADVCAAVNALDVRPDMSLFFLFARPPPAFDPVIALSLWHSGGVESARERFRDIFALGGMVVQEGMVPYDRLNDAQDHFCVKGGNKPSFSISFDALPADALAAVWPEWAAFSARPTAGLSAVLLELNNMAATHAVGEDATAVGPALRRHRFHGFVAPVYHDAALAADALALGRSFRDKMARATGGGDGSTYVLYANFAVGGEKVESLYGEGARLERLRGLKKAWDPEGVFNHYIPIV